MAKVFNKNKAMNHFLCAFLAAFHKATPFQGKTQSKLKSSKPSLKVKLALRPEKDSNILFQLFCYHFNLTVGNGMKVTLCIF